MVSDESIRKIIRGQKICYENGFILFSAAKLLFRRKFYPLCVAICTLSREELGKTHAISKSIYIDKDNKKDWNNWYYKKFKNHIRKSGSSFYSYKYAESFLKKGILNLKDEKDAIIDGKVSSKIKELGIYVDIDKEGNFYSPQELINKNIAYDYLKSTKKITDSYYKKYKRFISVEPRKLIEYYKEIIATAIKYGIDKIKEEETYSENNLEKIKIFRLEAIKIAEKYGL